MSVFKERFALVSIRQKVILAFIIGCVAIALSWLVMRVSFREMLGTVKNISAPNEKLRLVNSLFQTVSRLDQAQRSQAMRDPNQPYESFMMESQTLLRMIDTLRAYSSDNREQLLRLDSMEDILHQKDQLFIRYLRMRADFVYNKTLSKRINDLSNYIAVMGNQKDSNVVTTEHKTTTTVISNAADAKHGNESFFKRLFNRKKTDKDKALPQKSVTEDLKVRVDTVAIAQRDSMIKEIEATMRGIEKDQDYRGMALVSKEQELNNSSDQLINQLLTLIRKLEAEEIETVNKNSREASEVVNSSVTRIGIIMLLFVLITGILVFLIFSDISKSNTYRAQLVEAKEEAERLSAVKQRFLANMSHEIRTPLQSIIGFTEQVRKEEKPKRESLDVIYHSSEHLLQIVNEILDYSRIVSGKFSFEKQHFNMQPLLEDVAKTMELQAVQKKIAFGFSAPLTESLYSGDPFRLRQVLYNLLGNAIKFTEKGQVSLNVEERAFPKKTEFIFRISDTGIGITEEEKKRVFTSFEQADSSIQRTFGGTGLGLSIVKSLVEAQGGTIDLESIPGKGSTFTVKLTYQKAIVTNAAVETRSAGDQQKFIFDGKILLVDDDPFILQLCSGILDRHAIANVSCTSAVPILENNWDETIKLVLTDVRMPVIDGVEFCRQLRKKVKTGIHIVALTAQVLPEEKEALLEQGFDAILIKPFKEADLLKMIGANAEVAIVNETIDAGNNIDLDLKEIIRMSMNDTELLKSNLELLISETNKDLANIELQLAENNVKQVAETAHRLAGKTAQAGGKALAAGFRGIERELRNGDELNEKGIVALCEGTKLLVKKVEDYLLVVKRDSEH